MVKVLGAAVLAASVLLLGGGMSASAAEGACGLTDFNSDGVTNEADLEILKSYMGATEDDEFYEAVVDLDADGEIGLGDFNLFLSCSE
ncbi:MAG: dockerin type I domain-containing protein [bacterium]